MTKRPTLTIRLDDARRQRLDAAARALPYAVSITSIVERGIDLACDEIDRLVVAMDGNR